MPHESGAKNVRNTLYSRWTQPPLSARWQYQNNNNSSSNGNKKKIGEE